MKQKLAIVGIGPRGLYALENIVSKIAEKNGDSVHFLLFEKTGNFGNGQVYQTDQVDTNWININERILHLDQRQKVELDGLSIPAFPSYHDWAEIDASELSLESPDTYPPRAKIGQYLKERFETLAQPLLKHKIAFTYTEQVENITVLDNQKIVIETDKDTYEQIDEVLLTIGHQPTYTSKQIEKWQSYFDEHSNICLFEEPYPIKDILNCEQLTPESTIAIRGLGLAMIDVVRGIASKYGTFKITDEATKSCTYYSDYNLDTFFVPFSLDGLPPVPKPLNAKIDQLYQPTDEQLEKFRQQIGDPSIQRNATSPLFLIEAITTIIVNVFKRLPQTVDEENLEEQTINSLVKYWLKDDVYMHPLFTSRTQSVKQMMEEFVQMALNKRAISLDFCIGQVWRHCQPTIYQELSHNKCEASVFAEIIHLDERLKRYTYGPPIESIQQMIALSKSGVMNFDLANNPDIEMTSKGWKLKYKDHAVTASIMINSVLDAPQIKAVNSSVVQKLLTNERIKVVHDDFGVMTDENAYLISKETEQKLSVALLGRLAKGTIIGVDAILECFGDRPKDWANEAATKLTSSQKFNYG